MRLGLRDANQKFAEMVRAVRTGHEVVLTDRGRPLAVIRKVHADEPDARLMALAGEGLIRPAARLRPMPSPRWRPEPLSGRSIADTVGEDREETV